ncbi:hemolysin family protein [Tissierella sp. MSJ-40]|uniref:Hemolysin family protein n=1 Tax=Tissierella simiarum TaxID=2841534 RepID=A0ABS6E4B7_9FIRM|nr:hemolysin family protein [Tissierella simiarum]MBU5437752.1 hemolysin family protein [Tissierella simiarum]
MLTQIFILLILILFNAFFAASEIAIISLNDNKIRLMAEQGNKKAKILKLLLDEPGRFLSTIQIGITLAGFLASAFASESFAEELVKLMKKANIPIADVTLKTISVIIITIFLSYFTLILGELVPKRIAMQKSEDISMFVAKPLNALSKITSPFVSLLNASTNVVLKIFGIDPDLDEENVTEEEIRMMLDVGIEKGTIDENERTMINNIFDFDDKTVSRIMTHRTDVVSISLDSSLEEITEIVTNEKYTRLPVYEQNIDNIVGILHAKALLQYLDSNKYTSFNLREIIYEPYFIPISKRVDDLFKEFQKVKSHMAIVIDEYGGTAGIVTMEDLIEEIMGNIFDEYDEDEKEIEKCDENTFIIDGTVDIDTINEFFEIKIPIDDYDTIGGFIIGNLGKIPEELEYTEVEFDNVLFKVEKVDKKKILKIKACKI